MFRVMLLPIFLSLIQHLVKLGKIPIRATQTLSASVSYALCSLNPQAITFPLGSVQCTIPSSQYCALSNLSAQAQPLSSKTAQFSSLVSHDLRIMKY